MNEELRALPLVEVLSALGVETQWKTRKGGTEWYGKCPIHQAQKNNTSFSFDSGGRYHCFSCGKKGRGAIDLTMAMKGLGFQEAVTWLSSISPSASPGNRVIESPSKPGPPRVELSENAPYKASYEKYQVKSDWLEARGFTEETLARYGVFQYQNEKRRSAYNGQVMISIRRYLDGEVVGYLVRETLGRHPKYVWPKGVLKSLEVFGAWELKPSQPLRVAYLVESPFAVMKFHQLGFPAVSCYGWSVALPQLSILKQLAKGWVFLPDADKRTEALAQVVSQLAQTCWVKAPEYPADDPEKLSASEIQAL